MGKSFYGDIWREFWIDESGQEYDPEEIGKQVLEYIATTPLGKEIEDARQRRQATAQMRIVSVDPVIVLLYPSEYQRLQGVGQNLSMGTTHPVELAWTAKTDPEFAEPMQWLSPDLKAGPTDITFSETGEAAIPLARGKIKLVHTGDRCQISRE